MAKKKQCKPKSRFVCRLYRDPGESSSVVRHAVLRKDGVHFQYRPKEKEEPVAMYGSLKECNKIMRDNGYRTFAPIGRVRHSAVSRQLLDE